MNVFKYDVYLKSVPGFYAQYSGIVSVYAENDSEAVDKALNKLKRGAFQDRSRDMWKVEKVVRVY